MSPASWIILPRGCEAPKAPAVFITQTGHPAPGKLLGAEAVSLITGPALCCLKLTAGGGEVVLEGHKDIILE